MQLLVRYLGCRVGAYLLSSRVRAPVEKRRVWGWELARSCESVLETVRRRTSSVPMHNSKVRLKVLRLRPSWFGRVVECEADEL
jgi:hypothetical protein